MAKREKREKGSASPTGETPAALLERLEKDGVKRAKIGGFDLDGVLRGKYVSLDKLRSALGSGFGFCDVIFGWDINDALYDNARVTGWHSGYPDVQAVLDLATLRPIPWEPNVVAILADFRDGAGNAHPACPRSLLKSVIAKSEALGFSPKFSAEFEFFIFQENRDSLYQKQFQGLTPLDPQMMGYSWVRTGQDQELMRDIWDTCSDFDIELEGLHTETGPGVYEVALRYDDILRAADKAALFKTTLKQIVHRHGLSVTFMAKWKAELPGCGGHIHQSLWKNGKNAFFDAEQPNGMSQVMQHYVAGQMALLRELTALVSPTINSYKRYVPGLWAPLVPSWGIENRTCALRVIGTRDAKAIRVEHRQGAADINPYIAMAAGLGAGLYGIEHELPLPPETKGDPGLDSGERLPVNLRDANQLLMASQAAKEIFGEAFVDHYCRTRDWEVRCYERAVTDWELKRYFELT